LKKGKRKTAARKQFIAIGRISTTIFCVLKHFNKKWLEMTKYLKPQAIREKQMTIDTANT
jgi:hypothetical protein